MRRIAVLRPEPGNARTAAAIEALGGRAIRLPLFTIEPVAWDVPDAGTFDAVLATSANAFRHGGAGLTALRYLPVWAVGAATAEAARTAGFPVAAVGETDAQTLATSVPTGVRLLHLAGRERVALDGVAAVTLYAAPPATIAHSMIRDLSGCIALLHSARAARRLAGLLDDAQVSRATVVIAAISVAVAAAAGSGWERIAIAPEPTDTTLIALAMGLGGDA